MIQDCYIQDLDAALKIKPDYADAYYNRAQAYAEQTDLQKAIADLTQAIRFNPNLAEAYGHRGMLHAETGDKSAALTDLQKAAELFKQKGNREYYEQTSSYIKQIQQQQ